MALHALVPMHLRSRQALVVRPLRPGNASQLTLGQRRDLFLVLFDAFCWKTKFIQRERRGNDMEIREEGNTFETRALQSKRLSK